MERLIDAIRDILGRRLPGATFELHESVPGLRVGGMVLWDGWDREEVSDRQEVVWHALEAHLSRDDFLKITSLLTLTPGEIRRARDEVYA